MIDYQKVEYKVICDKLKIRTQPTIDSNYLPQYYIKGETIKTGTEPFRGVDQRLWVKYLGATSNTFRFVCYQDIDGEKFLERITPPPEEELTGMDSLNDDSKGEGEGKEENSSLEFPDINALPSLYNLESNNHENISNETKKNKFNISKPQKHDKFSLDNLLKRIKTLSLNIIRKELNSEIKSTNLYELQGKELLQVSQEEKINKQFYICLLNTTFREIFIPQNYKNKKNNNKELIDKIYEIYERDKSGRDEIGRKLIDIVDFFNKTYLDFWNGLTNLLNSNNMSIEETNEYNKFFNSLLENFNSNIVKELNDKKESDDYIKKIQITIKNYPSIINNMKDVKK